MQISGLLKSAFLFPKQVNLCSGLELFSKAHPDLKIHGIHATKIIINNMLILK